MKALKMFFQLAIIFIIGCKKIPHPIDSFPSTKVNDSWFGTWVLIHSDGRKEFYLLTHKSDLEFLVSDVTSGHRKIQMLGFISDVNNTLFCNLRQEGSDDSDYYVVRVLDPGGQKDNLKLALVYDKILRRLPNSAAVRDYITSNLDNASIYSDTIVLYRTAGVPY